MTAQRGQGRVAALMAVALAASLLPSATQAQTGPTLEQMKLAIYQQRLNAGSAARIQAKPSFNPERVAPQTANDLPGTYTVFQSFRDGNWEIYRAENGGAALSRLTANPAVDIEPRITLDGSKIAFASKRDGNYEIYTMNPDGSGQTRLTTDGAADLEPAWSADKSRIYFASNRTGNYDIWSMNADGSGQAAFAATANGEFEPVATLDGRVSWVQATDATNGIGEVRSGPAYGGSSYNQAGPCRFMARPVWSPNGKLLAYECDVDNDFWDEIIVPGAANNGNSALVIDLNQKFVDAQFNGWSPDGSQILFTRVTYELDDDQLVPTSFIPTSVNISGGMQTALPFATGADALVDWKWVDTQPPSASILGLSRYTYLNDQIPLKWGGTDIGPAGIAGYFVEYSLDSGPWQIYRWLTTDTSDSFIQPSFGSQRISFRVRAQDKAGNIGTWPIDAPGVRDTLLYYNGFVGTLSDNRDIRMSGVTIPISDNIPATVTTGIDGTFLSPFTEISPARTHTVTISKTGYVPLPSIGNTFLLGLRTFRPYFYASDDVVKNGQFNSAATNWLTSGNVSLGIFDAAGSMSGPGANLSLPSALLSQVVSVPVSMTHPTLSFINSWMMFGPSDGPPAQFLIKVQDGLTHTTVYAASATSATLSIGTPYAFAWVDMQPWAGKTVTMTFEVTAPSESLITARAIIDDISLSSWLTPVPQRVALSNALGITLTGQNFIAPIKLRLGNTPLPNATFINDKTISATLPANLPFGRYDVFVTNAGGQENVLPGALVIGTETFVPTLLR